MSVKTEKLKISLAQRILSLADNSILEKINELLNQQNIVAYNFNENPIIERDYISDLKKINKEIDDKSAIVFSSEELRKKIIDENNLAQ